MSFIIQKFVKSITFNSTSLRPLTMYVYVEGGRSRAQASVRNDALRRDGRFKNLKIGITYFSNDPKLINSFYIDYYIIVNENRVLLSFLCM